MKGTGGAVEATDENGVSIDLQALGEDFIRDPYPVYAALRERGPVHRVRTPMGPPAWFVVGYDAARATLTDPRLTKNAARFEPASVDPLGIHMLMADPPDHTRLRRLVTKEFTARHVEALAPRVQQLTDDLLDAMLATPGRRADLVDSVAFPLPMAVICELLGVPSDERKALQGWSNTLIGGAPLEEKRKSHLAIVDYLQDLVRRHRDAPGDDLLGRLIRSADDGDRLTQPELITMALLLIMAGHETTANLIANGTLALLTHPEQLAALRAQPSLMGNAVEEMLRYEGPVETPTTRYTVDPVEICGTVIPGGGEIVIPVLADADRDPSRFPEPDVFDIRRDARGHIAFGHGIHHCLGAPLARLEGRIVFGTLLERAPDLALDIHPAAITWRDGMMMRGPRHLPVTF